MRSKFDEQLNLLNQEMLHMGTMIEESIQEAIEAFINQDIEKAHKIMEGDEEIDHEQKKIENICFNLLMQQQPVARDLRTISAAMKMVTDMERIGDHASDISEMTVMMSKTEYKVNIEDVKKMATETMLMLIRSIEAYVEKDNKKAECVMKHDDIVDNLFDAVKLLFSEKLAMIFSAVLSSSFLCISKSLFPIFPMKLLLSKLLTSIPKRYSPIS